VRRRGGAAMTEWSRVGARGRAAAAKVGTLSRHAWVTAAGAAEVGVAEAGAAGAAAAVVLVFEVVELVFAVEWESEPEVVRAVVVEGVLNSSCGVLALGLTYLVRSGAAACYYFAPRTYAPGGAACRTGQTGSSAGTPRTYYSHPVLGCKFHSGRCVDEVVGKHFPEIRYVE